MPVLLQDGLDPGEGEADDNYEENAFTFASPDTAHAFADTLKGHFPG